MNVAIPSAKRVEVGQKMGSGLPTHLNKSLGLDINVDRNVSSG